VVATVESDKGKLMSSEKGQSIGRLGGVRRAMTVTGESLVRYGFLPTGDMPLLIEPASTGVDLITWAGMNRDLLEEKLQKHGGILLRGFGLRLAEDLETFINAVSGKALEYRERSSPRSVIKGNIYTSTDYPPSQPIFLHNENSYQKEWPLKVFFLCKQPPAAGGATPIADCRSVFARIEPSVRERFTSRKWMYVRNFGDGFGLDWQNVFQTSDKREVELHCQSKGIEVEWREGNRLRTRAVRPAVVRHPKTGDPVWFNHATFFHVSTLEPSVRDALVEEFKETELPANTYYGDGAPIEPEVMDHLRECYRSATISFPWQTGDLLMLDNMLVAHGRAPFSGPREILVGMAEPVSEEQVRL
jgi:alpha-ketoglutarate-dependent taurine dioxygenase